MNASASGDRKCDPLTCAATLLVIVGALNWGLYAFGFNLVDWLFVQLLGVAVLAQLVYVLVALSGVFLLVKKFSKCGCTMK